MNYGMIRGESNNQYHQNPAVSATKIKTFIQSPYLYYRKYVAMDVITNATKAMKLGSAAHTYILEPEKFGSEYETLPSDFNGRTNAGKDYIAELKQTGRTALTRSEFDGIDALRKAVYMNPTAAILLSNGESEVSWRIKATEMYDMQSRTDWFVESASAEQVDELRKYGIEIAVGQPFISDLKTTAELDSWFRDNYGNAIYAFGAYLQYSFYLAVINAIRKMKGKEIVRHWFFIVVEKQVPNDCAVIALDERSFKLAQRQLTHHLDELMKCYESGNWTGYKDRGVLVSGVPKHIADREEALIFSER